MFASRIDKSVEACIGRMHQGRALAPGVQGQALEQQIRAVMRLTRLTLLVVIWMALPILGIGYATTGFPTALIWFSAFLAGLYLNVRTGHDIRLHGLRRTLLSSTVRRVSVNAMITGMALGTLPALSLLSGSADLQGAAPMVLVGNIAVIGLSYAPLPIACLAFLIPAFFGLVLGQFVQTAGLDLQSLFIPATVALVTAVASIRYSDRFAQVAVLRAKIKDQASTIRLLLKDFGENAGDWLWSLDQQGRIANVSERFSGAAGQEPCIMAGQGFCDWLRGLAEDGDPVIDSICASMRAGETFRDHEICLAIDGETRWWRLTGRPVFSETGELEGFQGVGSDITSRKIAEDRISFLAHNDALTGLTNRAHFTEHLNRQVARLERYGTPFSVLYLDLDQFKAVNDTKGHPAGDKLLVEVSRRLKAHVRGNDVLARLGGDEFAIISHSQVGQNETARLAERLVAALSEPYMIDNEIISMGASIGIAVAPINGTRPDQILRNADLALYRAKSDGRGTFRFFQSEMDADARERRALELELKQAVKNGEFVLHYQPLVGAEDDTPTGFEALLRWNHPIRSLVSPAEFVPIAEQTGLIREIGDWAIMEACSAAARWPKGLTVAVNLSAQQFERGHVARTVANALERSGLDPRLLELEITESLLLDQPDQVLDTLTELKKLGVTIAMDDFGTGYSSLSYLLKFPFDKIKIDKSFVNAINDDEAARDILRTIGKLGESLKMKITAEGVETKEQVAFLRELSCDHLQGFYFAKPLTEAELAAYLLELFSRDLDADVAALSTRTPAHGPPHKSESA